MDGFKIDAFDLAWIDGTPDDPDDLCLHGNAVAVIGGRRLEYQEATVSAAALYLLKTLTEDHIICEDNQMLPCCGHFLIPNDAGTEVIISGCRNGIDWSVLHEDGRIKLVLEDGHTVFAETSDYCREVLAFVQRIEDFYNACPPRKLPEDDWERRGWLTFWQEWHRRKRAAMVFGAIEGRSHKYCTYLRDVFPAIQNAQRSCNWLITDAECNISNPIEEEIRRQGYCWITGEDLTAFAQQDETQWIGAVFSGFEKDIPLEKILECPLPIWEHPGFWYTPLTMQHPLASVEIVPWDSAYTLLLSKNERIIADYRQAYPASQDLAVYNTRSQKRRDPP